MEFRKCDDGYFQKAKDMYHEVVRDLKQTVNYPKWGAHHPSEEDLQSAQDRGELYICVEDGKVAGAVVLNEDPEGCYEAGDWKVDLDRGEYLVIHLLTAAVDFRGRGIGRYIVKKCIEKAEQEGYKAVRLDVVPGNKPAIDLYTSEGFTYAGTKDLLRDIKAVPLFELYEKNLK
ncbi:MAG: GNAT family N-acetyltransferase [Eubacterium sp.]|nr:GNAT family N-acetyltransferase [Eubacterium sp.]